MLACNAVLGLEDVKLKAADGSGGSAGTSGAQGGSAGTSGLQGGSAGTSGADAGGGGEATGGTAGSGTGGSGGRIGTDCVPGEYVLGTAGSDRICEKCSPGSYSSVPNTPSCPSCDSGSYSADPGATECAEWTDCDPPGTYVSEAGSAMRDRQCADCEGDTQTTIQNQSQCLPPGACEAGTEQTAPAQCMDCEVGTYCPGGETPGAPCESGTWDHDEMPGTECIGRSPCLAGFHVKDDGSATMNRTCEPCDMGTFSTSTNAQSCTGCTNGSFAATEGAQSCTPWTVCPQFYTEAASGNSVRDRTCEEGGWTRQVGMSGQDDGDGLALDANGNVYVVGSLPNGELPGQTNVGMGDAFVMKFDGTGMLLWTRQFGSTQSDFATGVAVDASGNVFVVGGTFGTFPGQASAGASDVFVVKYNAAGTLVWTQQFGTSLTDNARAVSVDSNGNAYIAGETAGALAGQTNAGTFDAFVVKDDAAGTMVWARQLGTSNVDSAGGERYTERKRVRCRVNPRYAPCATERGCRRRVHCEVQFIGHARLDPPVRERRRRPGPGGERGAEPNRSRVHLRIHDRHALGADARWRHRRVRHEVR